MKGDKLIEVILAVKLLFIIGFCKLNLNLELLFFSRFAEVSMMSTRQAKTASAGWIFLDTFDLHFL